MAYQREQNDTWNLACTAREHVSEAIDKLAEFYGTLVLDTDLGDDDDDSHYTFTVPIQEARGKLREASSALTEIMMSEKAESQEGA